MHASQAEKMVMFFLKNLFLKLNFQDEGQLYANWLFFFSHYLT